MTRKKWIDEKTSLLELENNGEGKECKVEVIHNNAVYVKELKNGQFPGLY